MLTLTRIAIVSLFIFCLGLAGRSDYEDQKAMAEYDQGDLTYCPSDGVWSRDWHNCQ